MKKTLCGVLAAAACLLALTGCRGTDSPPAARSAAKPRLQLAARFDVPGAREIVFRGDIAFIAQNMAGMTSADISNPQHPQVVRTYPPELIQPLYFRLLEPDTLVVADRFRGFCLWKLSGRDSITTLSQLPLPGITTHLDIFERGGRRYAAVACGGEGLTTVDFTDSSSPTIVGRYTLDVDYSRNVVAWKDVCFLSDNNAGGLKIIDLSRPADPRLLMKMHWPTFWDSASISGDLLVACNRIGGLRVFRLTHQPPTRDDRASTPTVQYLCNVVRSKDTTRNILLHDKFGVVADDEAGLDLYDFSNPALPVLLDEFRTEHTAVTAAFYRDYYYVPAWNAGVYVMRVVSQ